MFLDLFQLHFLGAIFQPVVLHDAWLDSSSFSIILFGLFWSEIGKDAICDWEGISDCFPPVEDWRQKDYFIIWTLIVSSNLGWECFGNRFLYKTVFRFTQFDTSKFHVSQ